MPGASELAEHRELALAGELRPCRPEYWRGPRRISRRRRPRRRQRDGSWSSSTGGMNRVRILAGNGICGSAAGAMIHGSEMAMGKTFRRANLSSPSAFASLSPRMSTGMASAPPTVATGTMGTPIRIASLTKPVRPPSVASSRLLHGRSESTSPPGHTITSRPSANAVDIESGAAGNTPMDRKTLPINGNAISASCAVPCRMRFSPKCRHHCAPTVHASHTNGAPECTPTTRTGDSGIVSQPVDLHPEVAIHHPVPEPLLTVHRHGVLIVEIPISCAVGDHGPEAPRRLLASLLHLQPSRCGITLRLLA